MYVCMPAPPIVRFVRSAFHYAICVGLAHLSCARELQWSECSLQVGGVGLEVIESASNAGLELRRALAGRAVSRNFVESTHDFAGVVVRSSGKMFEISRELFVGVSEIVSLGLDFWANQRRGCI
jgi:hypothetical protein